MTVYAFSSENWQRGQEEVDYLMQLFNEVLKSELQELARAGARLRFIGDLAGMPADLQAGLQSATDQTRDNQGLNLQVALNYGSRLEIATAVKKLVVDAKAGKVSEEEITPELLGKYLYTADIPDPDLMIRTGGEMRLSNYLLWQSAYTELYVTPIMWPGLHSPPTIRRSGRQLRAAPAALRWGLDSTTSARVDFRRCPGLSVLGGHQANLRLVAVS